MIFTSAPGGVPEIRGGHIILDKGKKSDNGMRMGGGKRRGHSFDASNPYKRIRAGDKR